MENTIRKYPLDDHNDPFSSLSTVFVALSFFYTILFQLLNSNINANEFWRQILIFLLLLMTFFFSGIVFFLSQKQNEFVRATGFFIVIFWIAIYLYFNNIVINMFNYFIISFKSFFESANKFGLAWLIVIPLLIIPLISIIFSIKYFKSLQGDKKVKYWVYSIALSIISYLFVIYPQYIFNNLAKIITLISIDWIQVLFAGIFMGVMLSLIIAPIYPLFFEIINFIIEFLKKKKK